MDWVRHGQGGARAPFPPLTLCSVVDSRLSSRREILSDVKSSALFEEIAEAHSVEHGLGLLAQQDTDACIIGPSVSQTAATHFLDRAGAMACAATTAFIAITAGHEDENPLLSHPRLNGALKRPYLKGSLSEQIVRSVVSANKSSIWRTLLEQGTLPVNAAEPVALGAVNRLVQNEMHHVIERTFPELRELAAGHEQGRYGLQINGSPTKPTLAAIRNIIGKLQLHTSHRISLENSFYDFLEAAIIRWFAEMVIDSEEAATVNLRRELASAINKNRRDER